MGGSKQTQTTSMGPWQPAQEGLKSVLEQAQSLGGNTGLFTPQFSNDTNQAIAQLASLGGQGSVGANLIKRAADQTAKGMPVGMDALKATASGSMLDSNPYLDAVLAKSKQDAADSINAQFSAAGRYGSGAQTTALTRELGGIENTARMNNFNTERDRQLNSAQLLGSLGLQGANMSAQIDQLKADQVMRRLQAGQLKDAQNDATRTAPLKALEWQSGLMTPIAGLGQEGTTTQKTKGNVLGQVLGAGMSLAGLFGGGPAGASMLGGLGGLGGAIGGANGAMAPTMAPTMGSTMGALAGSSIGGVPGISTPFFGAFSGMR